MRNLLTEFHQFILRGNVVQGLVRDFINPLIAALFGKPDVSKFHLHSPSRGLFYGISSTGCRVILE